MTNNEGITSEQVVQVAKDRAIAELQAMVADCGYFGLDAAAKERVAAIGEFLALPDGTCHALVFAQKLSFVNGEEYLFFAKDETE